jgi:outer membrane protein OmpA-like peptidoglycan-associated protein
MGGRALEAPVLDAARPRQDDGSRPSPAAQLLDALQRGDDQGVLAACGESTTVTADIMGWSGTGLDQIEAMLVRTRNRFPGLVYESRTRRTGFGLVIEEARVHDASPDTLADSDETERKAAGPDELDDLADLADIDGLAESLDHPMYDAPVVSGGTELQLWRDLGDEGPAAPLNLPVRVTVRHDDLQVHEVTLSFPAALLKRALGMHVDPLEMSLSEVQSAFIAPVGAEFTAHELTRPEIALAPRAEPESEVVTEEPRRRRRRGRRLLLMLLLVGALTAGGWWYVQERGVPSLSAPSSAPSPSPSAVAPPTPTPSPSAQASPSARSTQQPMVTHSAPASTPARKPNVTLRSDLAFGFNSSLLSPEAKSAVAAVAKQVLQARLTGKIYVDGYTDNLGSAAYGKVLSQRRADAVSSYLQSRLAGADVSIVSVGHGEADPVASNATSDGRKSNRRVTITLPRS